MLHSAMEQTGGASPTGQLSVSKVGAADIDHVWVQIREQIHRGQRYGSGDTLSEGALYSSVKRGDTEMWAVVKGGRVMAVAFLQFVKRERGTALLVKELAGHGWDEWGEGLQKLIREYGKRAGAYTTEAVVRPGLEKWLAPMGWTRKAIVMEADNGRNI